jgi:hypothetical protein
VPTTIQAKSELRLAFFELLFKDYQGFLCIATTEPINPKTSFKQRFFKWPEDFKTVENYILSVEKKHNVYFCVNLLSEQKRLKEYALSTDFLWADLDTANPDGAAFAKLPPPIVVQSSPGRWQAYWRLTTKLEPFQAEIYSKRIAYHFDADRTGWDLTQLLRVPFTPNMKYAPHPTVMLERMLETTAPPLLFEALPKPIDSIDTEGDVPDLPEDSDLPQVENVIYKYTAALRRSAFTAIYTQTPGEGDDWSRILWRLIHICFEAGMDSMEVYAVARSAPCNKYERDGRPIEHLWKDINKAQESQATISQIQRDFKALVMPTLVDEPASETILDRYRDWAKDATDAVPEFHDLCATIGLSSIVSNSVRLDTSYGLMVPNLWGLILGDSTLSRKTTAMRMIMDIIAGLDSDMILATDGSAEGLLSGLATRPNKTSIFYKDEISGFFDSMNKKDYLAGMSENLTALYDVPAIFTRRLRKETIIIESPAFVLFGGGVRDRVYETINEEYVLSGFLPRFLVVSGETDMTRLRPTGPATDVGIAKRARLVSDFADIYENYATEVTIKIGDQQTRMPSRVVASLTSDAWAKYGELETLMWTTASESTVANLALPTFERLSRSMLKLSIVLSACRQQPKDEKIQVELDDVLNAAWYIQNWGRFSIDLVNNAGKRISEKILEKILRAINQYPGIARSTIMQHYHLNKRETDEILGTLEERQLVRTEKRGRATSYYIN